MTTESIVLDLSMIEKFVGSHELDYMEDKVAAAFRMLHEGTGPGSHYTGWLNLPDTYDREEYRAIKETAAVIREKADVLIVIGIGGSYLGARSALEMLCPPFYNQLPAESRPGPQVYFAGNSISAPYLASLLELVKDREVYVNVVSKSGTTLEPAVAFRAFRQLLEEKYGQKEAAARIIATTDKEKGVLKELADREGYRTFVVPDDVGGRYSVLTAVGLLPMAAAGIDIDQVMAGAAAGKNIYGATPALDKNPACRYAAVRNILYARQKTVEALVTYEPVMGYFVEWWKQLFGESEGKDGKGIFPAGLTFSTDLHSMGQYVQDGLRNMFLTTMWVEKAAGSLAVKELSGDDDRLNYLKGREIHYINEKAFRGTVQAHADGGIPNLIINIPEINPYYYGMLVYFFQKACALSAYLLGVNPFDQPGVEAYKKNMFTLLGK